VTVFQADYFKEEALRKRFNVSSFSTLVVFRGNRSVRALPETFARTACAILFAKAL
jgi:hypothetical protein